MELVERSPQRTSPSTGEGREEVLKTWEEVRASLGGEEADEEEDEDGGEEARSSPRPSTPPSSSWNSEAPSPPPLERSR